MTQIMNLLTLPKAIQDRLLRLPAEKQHLYSERRLRKIVGIHSPKVQCEAFEDLAKGLFGSVEA